MSKSLERKIVLNKSEFAELILTLIMKKDNVFIKIGDGKEKTHYHILHENEMQPVITDELVYDQKNRHTWRGEKKTSIRKMVSQIREWIDREKSEIPLSRNFIVAVPSTKLMDIKDKLGQQKTIDLVQELTEENIAVKEDDGEIINIDDPSMYRKIVFSQLYRTSPHFGYYKENGKIIIVYATTPFKGMTFSLDALISMVLDQAKEMGLVTYLKSENVFSPHSD